MVNPLIVRRSVIIITGAPVQFKAQFNVSYLRHLNGGRIVQIDGTRAASCCTIHLTEKSRLQECFELSYWSLNNSGHGICR